jgi:DNA-binding GntR family transcriptional regulator
MRKELPGELKTGTSPSIGGDPLDRPREVALGRDTLGIRLRAAIEAEILDGRLKPGDKLDELVLGERFQVSRTPVREALRGLSAAGLVEFQPRQGAIVARPTVGEVVDLFEVVAELEGVAARLAIDRLDEASQRRIIEAHESCREAAGGSDAARYYAMNGLFHEAVRSAAANAVLAHEIASLDKRLSPYRRFITFRPGRTATALREHEAIVEAIIARDGGAAAAAMRDHVRILGEDALALAKSLRF